MARLTLEDAPADPGVTFTFTTFPAPARWQARGVSREWSWKEVMERGTTPDLWPGAGTLESAASRLGALSFARFRDDSRVVMRDEAIASRESARRVEAVHGLVVDYDDEPTCDPTHLEIWWGSHAWVAWTSPFHESPMGDKPPGPRWRLFIPYTRPVNLEEAIGMGHWARHPRHDVGMVGDTTEIPWRATENPSVAPGGYLWAANAGAALDPDVALEQLRIWRIRDQEQDAEEALGGTRLQLALDRFLARQRAPERRVFFALPGDRTEVSPLPDEALRTSELPPWPALSARTGGLWPGRIWAVLGGPGSGRSAFSLQIVEAAAKAQQPVLWVLTRSSQDEALANLIALLSDGEEATPAAVLQGAASADALQNLSETLAERYPNLHIWTPTGADRTSERLTAAIHAMTTLYGDRPPLVIVDHAEGWAHTETPDAGCRSLMATLRDAARSGTLGPAWPGAAVVVVGQVPQHAQPHVASPATLAETWESGTLLAKDGLGPLGREANLVFLLTIEPTGTDRKALVLIARNREGITGPLPMRFDARRRRFSEA